MSYFEPVKKSAETMTALSNNIYTEEYLANEDKTKNADEKKEFILTNSHIRDGVPKGEIESFRQAVGWMDEPIEICAGKSLRIINAAEANVVIRVVRYATDEEGEPITLKSGRSTMIPFSEGERGEFLVLIDAVQGNKVVEGVVARNCSIGPVDWEVNW